MSTSPSHLEALAWDLTDRLRKALRVGAVTVGQMADELDVSRNTVGNYLSGRTSPSTATVRVWALRCGVPYRWLKDGIDPAEGPDTPGGQGIPDSPCNEDSSNVLNFRSRLPIASAAAIAA